MKNKEEDRDLVELNFYIHSYFDSFFLELKKMRKENEIFLLDGWNSYRSSSYFNEVNLGIRTREHYERYSQISFENNFLGTKIKRPLTDGVVIMKVLNFDEEYSKLYEPIILRYNILTTEDFNYDKYVELCR